MNVSIETVGVLLTLVYLAFELRANNRIAKTNGHRDIIQQLSAWFKRQEDIETSSILVRGAQDFNVLTPAEKAIYDSIQYQYFHICEQVFYMVRGKLIPEHVCDAFFGGAAMFIYEKGTNDWWKISGELAYPKDFVEAAENTAKDGNDYSRILDSHAPYLWARESLD
jgi:hypothetical protein|tara:strand:+ start:209 stop:709 length:501 start_codon:yes stop_codon:yes gene_type:complete